MLPAGSSRTDASGCPGALEQHYAFLAHNRSLHRTGGLAWFTAELSRVVYDLTNMIITELRPVWLKEKIVGCTIYVLRFAYPFSDLLLSSASSTLKVAFFLLAKLKSKNWRF
jgi:hypothetical protein